MEILVVGGCGYIGSHMVKALANRGHQVIVLDNLSTGYKESLLAGELVIGDFSDRNLLDKLFSSHDFDGVLHFASLIQVGESMIRPDLYYRNNVAHTLTLLEAVKDHGIGAFIFSSSAAVFGTPAYVPIDEAHLQNPINPYGSSKSMVESMLRDFDRAFGLPSVSLRYFNAAGADPEARIGERHQPETHLIPLAIQAAMGKRPPLNVFGRDYNTDDGTCIRDYIHVDDLADAHLKALEYLWAGGETSAFNLGNGKGFSVQEVLIAVEKVGGQEVPCEDAPRRLGDPAVLVADATRAREVLGWRPRYTELETIVEHAWAWETNHP